MIHSIKHLSIFDTTLRDGEQAPGYSLSVESKVAIAEASQAFGVNVIETGFPNSSPIDFEATRQICRLLKKAKPCGFSRTVKSDIDSCAQAMKDATNPQIQLASIGSDIHIKYKREITREKVIAEAVESIRYARSLGFNDISLAVEDATRGDIEFIKCLIGAGIENGATTLAIPDTVGYCLPHEFYGLIKSIRDFVGEDIRISLHCHNDLGLAVANSIAGIEAGGDEVQATFCGIGERAGNTCMEEIAAALIYKGESIHRNHDLIQHRLYDTCQLVAGHLKLSLPWHKPIIGRNAFATEAGMHQQGVLKYRFTYEFMRAEDFGAESKIMVGRHSGRNILRKRLQDSGIKEVDQIALDTLYENVMNDSNAERFNDLHLLKDTYNICLKGSAEEIRESVLN